MTEEEVRQIKNHVFFDKHIKYDGSYEVFTADYDMAVAWKRLSEGKCEDTDLLLLKHELLESQVEKMYNLTAAEAHEIADREYPWNDALIDKLGEGGEPDGILYEKRKWK